MSGRALITPEEMRISPFLNLHLHLIFLNDMQTKNPGKSKMEFSRDPHENSSFSSHFPKQCTSLSKYRWGAIVWHLAS